MWIRTAERYVIIIIATSWLVACCAQAPPPNTLAEVNDKYARLIIEGDVYLAIGYVSDSSYGRRSGEFVVMKILEEHGVDALGGESMLGATDLYILEADVERAKQVLREETPFIIEHAGPHWGEVYD